MRAGTTPRSSSSKAIGCTSFGSRITRTAWRGSTISYRSGPTEVASRSTCNARLPRTVHCSSPLEMPANASSTLRLAYFPRPNTACSEPSLAHACAQIFSVHPRSVEPTAAKVSTTWCNNVSSAGTNGPMLESIGSDTTRSLRRVTEEELTARFAEWLRAQVGAPVRLDPFTTPGHGGFSNETHLTTAEWDGTRRGLVLRLAPAGPGIFPSYDLDRQARVLQALRAHTDVPVPEVLWSEQDPGVLGRDFYVMERVDGRIPPDRPGYQFVGWVKDASPDEQARVLDAGLGAMARIHRVDWERADLGFLDRSEHGTGALDQELGYWRSYLDWASGDERFDALETIWEWCVSHRPPEPSS